MTFWITGRSRKQLLMENLCFDAGDGILCFDSGDGSGLRGCWPIQEPDESELEEDIPEEELPQHTFLSAGLIKLPNVDINPLDLVFKYRSEL